MRQHARYRGFLVWGTIGFLTTLVASHAITAEPADDPAGLRAYLTGNGLLNRGLHSLAAAEYRKFLDEHPDHEKAPIARYGLGVCLFRTQQYPAAITELTRLHGLQKFVYAAEVGTMLGQAYLLDGVPDKAIAPLELVVRRHTKHDLADDAAALLIEALSSDGRYGDVIAECEAFGSRWPSSAQTQRVRFFHAFAQMNQADYAGAADRFERLIADEPKGPLAQQALLLAAQCHHNNSSLHKAARWYRRVIDAGIEEQLPDALLGLGTVLRNEDRADEAGKLLDRLIRDYPNNHHLDAARLERGRVWFEQGKYDRAFSVFDQINRAESGLGDQAEYWLAKCELRQGNFAAAAQRLEGAESEFSESDLGAEFVYDRAVALARAGRDDAAAEALGEFRSRYPDHTMAADALHLLATLEHRGHRFDVSGALCRSFAERFEKHPLAADMAFLAAENDFLAERFDKAAVGFDRFLDIYPSSDQAQQAAFRVGMSLYRLARFDDALPLLEDLAPLARRDDTYLPVLLALGQIAFERSEWEDAVGHLRTYVNAVADRGALDDALLKLGLALQRQGRYDDAVAQYDRLINDHADSPHRVHAAFERAQSLMALDRVDEADAGFRWVLEHDGESRFTSFALNHLGSAATQRGDYAEAAELFEKVLDGVADGTDEIDVLRQRGMALIGAQQFAEAERVLAEFLRRTPSGKYAAEVTAHLVVARSRQDKHVKALSTIETVQREYINELSPSLRSTVMYEKAWCLQALGESDEAARVYRALLDLDGSGTANVYALLELAGIEADAGRCSDAIPRLTRVVHGRGSIPESVREQAIYRLAICEYELGAFERTAELLQRLLSEFPKSSLTASACYFCGDSLAKIGRHKPAVKVLKRLIDEFPSDASCSAAMLRLGECLASLQRWSQSEQTFTAYLERYGDSNAWYQAQFGIGWARENQGRQDEALDAYRKIVDRHQGPTAARAQFQIGECLFARKEYESAVAELLKVDILYSYPEWSAAALYEAGRCFEAMGKLSEAHQQFSQVAERYQQTAWSRQAAQRLAAITPGVLPGR